MFKKLEYPERIFSVSDCHGGHEEWNPLASPDVVEQLTQSVRSDLPGVARFDNFGALSEYNRYIVEAALRLHSAHKPQRRTGLFINSAPRTKENSNGQPFYRAELDHGLTVVATPLSVLSGVRDRVNKLYRLPNEGNTLYDGSREQHRSSYTPRLLADNHGIDLEDVNLSEIPELEPYCELAYVDRFGNLVISGIGPRIEGVRQRIGDNIGKTVRLQIGELRDVTIDSSLPAAKAGDLITYANDGDVEILAKWDSLWSPKERLQHSAWGQFGRPEIGTNVTLAE